MSPNHKKDIVQTLDLNVNVAPMAAKMAKPHVAKAAAKTQRQPEPDQQKAETKQRCNRVQSATEWTASVQTLHMSCL